MLNWTRVGQQDPYGPQEAGGIPFSEDKRPTGGTWSEQFGPRETLTDRPQGLKPIKPTNPEEVQQAINEMAVPAPTALPATQPWSGWTDATRPQSGQEYFQNQGQTLPMVQGQLNEDQLLDQVADAIIERRTDGIPNNLIPPKNFQHPDQGAVVEFELKALEYVQTTKAQIIANILETLRTEVKPTLERMAEQAIDPDCLERLRGSGWQAFIPQRAISDIVKGVIDAFKE